MFPMEEAQAHAAACYPSEACGVWVRTEAGVLFRPCQPSPIADHFALSPQEWLDAEQAGEMVGIYHGHPDGQPVPSPQDATAIDAWGLPWVIQAWPSAEVGIYEPSPVDPLLRRSYSLGTRDCWSICADYYARLGVRLPDRPQGEPTPGTYEAAGFFEVSDLQPHDLLILQFDAPHHAIYLGGGRILHHVTHKLSCRAVYGSDYRARTTKTYRHRDLAC